MIEISRIFGETDRLYIKTLDEPMEINGGVNHHFAICNKENDEVIQEIKFQKGPIKENGVNGIQNVDLINIVIDNLEHFQKGQFACEYNQLALEHLRHALSWLNQRTNDRKARGVEGENKQ